MEEKLETYESMKRAILTKKARKIREPDFDDMDMDPDPMMSQASRPVGISDVVQVGSKVVMGAGLGLLAGVAALAITASVGEIILAGVVTKIAGVVGGGAGLSLGLKQMKSRK